MMHSRRSVRLNVMLENFSDFYLLKMRKKLSSRMCVIQINMTLFNEDVKSNSF